MPSGRSIQAHASAWRSAREGQYAHIDQTNQSDVSLLTRLAKRYDAVMTVKDGRRLLMQIGAGTSASGKPLPTLEIRKATGRFVPLSRVAGRKRYVGACALAYVKEGQARIRDRRR